jgi:CheY-like chemotaxis protein
MNPEQLARIFAPFEQAGDSDRKAEGTGLGLAITQKIIQMMKGQLKVESILGIGTKFWLDLDLPKAVQDIGLGSVNSKNIIGFKGDKNKILVVDDRGENRSFIINLLEPLGFNLMQASNGQEGLDKALEFQPHLIVTDLVMPVMDGLEMTRRIRNLTNFRDVILIASSASVFSDDRQNSLKAGCNDFVPKPIQAEDLLNKIQNYLKLEWIYEVNNNFSFKELNFELVLEPPEELGTLFKAARIGDIETLEQEALRLKQLDNKYLTLTTKVLQLAKEFREKEILVLIKQYISAQ